MSFQMPPKAQAAVLAAAERRGERLIVWNGTEALWEPDDIELALEIKGQLIRGEITGQEAKNQISVIHEIKQLGGFRLREESQ